MIPRELPFWKCVHFMPFMVYMYALENGNADEKRYNYSCFLLNCFSTWGVTLETQSYYIFLSLWFISNLYFPFWITLYSHWVVSCVCIWYCQLWSPRYSVLLIIRAGIFWLADYLCINEVLMANDRGGK
jgi:hypothetical protein